MPAPAPRRGGGGVLTGDPQGEPSAECQEPGSTGTRAHADVLIAHLHRSAHSSCSKLGSASPPPCPINKRVFGTRTCSAAPTTEQDRHVNAQHTGRQGKGAHAASRGPQLHPCRSVGPNLVSFSTLSLLPHIWSVSKCSGSNSSLSTAHPI